MEQLQTENLRQLLQGTNLNNYQKALANKEYVRLIFYINELENKVKNLAIHNVSVSSSYEGKESRPLKFSELELILIRYKIMLEEEPDRYTEAEFIQQEDYRRELFK